MIECVPNVSEGRDLRTLDLISDAISSVPGVSLLHRDVGWDAHRTVFTFIGDSKSLGEAVSVMYAVALEKIDLRLHVGPHPRIGAVDVCPFVPLSENTGVEQFVPELALELSKRFSIPVFLYEKSARMAARRRLFDIRRGEFEGLAEKLKRPEWFPDFGPAKPHPSFGATVLGHRDFLVAFNISLGTTELSVARSVAREIRSLRGGSEPEWESVRAIGWAMPSYHCVQVSLNIVDIHAVSLVRCFSKVRELADRYGVRVIGSELIGLVPEVMLEKCSSELRLEGAQEDRFSRVVSHLGLDFHRPFNLSERILARSKQSAIPGFSSQFPSR